MTPTPGIPSAPSAPPARGDGTGLSLPGQRPLEVGGARAAARAGAAAARGAAEVFKRPHPKHRLRPRPQR